MAGKGRPRVPQAILEARNSWRAAARKKEGVLSIEASIPDTPPELTGATLEVFNKLASMLSDMGVIHRADEFAMQRYCVMLIRWKKLSARNPRETVKEPVFNKMGEHLFDRIKINPKVKVISMLNNELLQLERQFGLTPSARAYLKPQGNGEKEKTTDPKERFFSA